MSNYKVRLTFPYSEIQAVIEQFGEVSEGIVAYEHKADKEVSRTHVHLLLVGCKMSTDTLKNYVRRKIGSVDRNDWSFEKAEDTVEGYEKYITYMSKGNLDCLYSKGMTKEFIDACKVKWVDPTVSRVKVINGKFVKEVDDSSNISKRQLVEEMVAHIGDSECDTRVILDGIRKVLVQHRIVVGMYKVMDYYDAYLMYGQKDRWLNMVASKIEKRNL